MLASMNCCSCEAVDAPEKTSLLVIWLPESDRNKQKYKKLSEDAQNKDMYHMS